MPVDELQARFDAAVEPIGDVEAVVAEVRRRRRRLDQRRRVGRTLVAACSALIVTGVGVLAMTRGGDGDGVTTEPPEGSLGVVEVPAPGEVVGASLADGRPVWVVGDTDGEPLVLDAVSAHRPFGVGQVVGWCPGPERFVDPMWGSHFSRSGEVVGGPAPVGLGRYEVRIEGSSAVVAGGPTAMGRWVVPGPEDLGEPLDGCYAIEEGYPHAGYVPGDGLLLHPVVASPRRTLDRLDGVGWQVVDGATVIVTHAGSYACADPEPGRELQPPSCPDPVEVRGVEPDPAAAWHSVRGALLVQVSDGAITGVVAVEGVTLDDGPTA